MLCLKPLWASSHEGMADRRNQCLRDISTTGLSVFCLLSHEQSSPEGSRLSQATDKHIWLMQPSQSSTGTNTFKWIRNVSIKQHKVNVRKESNLLWWMGPVPSYRHDSPLPWKRELVSTHMGSSRFLTSPWLTPDLETRTCHEQFREATKLL